MIGIVLRRANGCRPTASPTVSPMATESAKATASSKIVMRSAAGTPLVSITEASDPNTREGGAMNIGSMYQRAAISHASSSRMIDAEPHDAGMAVEIMADRVGTRHRCRLPRASSDDTRPLRTAAITTTKAM